MNWWPSATVPFTATKAAPGFTFRLSIQMSNTSIPVSPCTDCNLVLYRISCNNNFVYYLSIYYFFVGISTPNLALLPALLQMAILLLYFARLLFHCRLHVLLYPLAPATLSRRASPCPLRLALAYLLPDCFL